MNKPILTIWEIYNPNVTIHDAKDDDYFYRWTFEAYGIFITNTFKYVHEGQCKQRGSEWVSKHGYNNFKIKHNSRSNQEFIT